MLSVKSLNFGNRGLELPSGDWQVYTDVEGTLWSFLVFKFSVSSPKHCVYPQGLINVLSYCSIELVDVEELHRVPLNVM